MQELSILTPGATNLDQNKSLFLEEVFIRLVDIDKCVCGVKMVLNVAVLTNLTQLSDS